MIVFAEEALADFERIWEFNFVRDPTTALTHIDEIQSGLEILESHPEIGRRVGPGSTLRELIISHGHTGYVALYEYSPQGHPIRVVAVRHQREAGYRR